MNIANIAFHTLNEALAPVPEPSLEEILAGLRNDLETAKTDLYLAEMRSDQWRWKTEREDALRRVAALRRHIQIVEGL